MARRIMASSRIFTIGNHWQRFSEVEGGAATDHAGIVVAMNAEELEDLAEAWAAWWAAYGARGYVGAVLPPIATTERVLGRKGFTAATFRRRAGRRERTARNLTLPLG